MGNWRNVAESHPLATTSVVGRVDSTPRTGRRTVSRASLRGPEMTAVPHGDAGLPGFNAQLGSPVGPAAPNWTPATAPSENPAPAAQAPAPTDWWYR